MARSSARSLLLACAALLACACGASAPPPEEPRREAVATDAATPETETAAPAAPSEAGRAPRTGSYEEALSTPEALDVHDDHVHLTDAQLTGPMRGAIAGCKVPPQAKVSIRTAVQNGRAIGITVEVRVARPKSGRPPPRAMTRTESKTRARIVACVEKNVRALTWPPSRRRDSFTTEF